MSDQLLQQKLASVLNLPLKDEQFAFAVRELNAIHPAEGELLRASVRSCIEERSVEIAESLLAAFRPIESSIVSLEQQLNSMRKETAHMQTRLAMTRKDAGSMLAEAQSLGQERKKATLLEKAAQQFVNEYTLTEEETSALTVGPVIGHAFFEAILRLDQIKERSHRAIRTGG